MSDLSVHQFCLLGLHANLHFCQVRGIQEFAVNAGEASYMIMNLHVPYIMSGVLSLCLFFIIPDSMMFQYFVKIVPTTYIKTNGEV